MASFPSDKNSKYHRVIFTKTYRLQNGTKEKKRKTFYFRKDEFTKTEIREWKKRREIAFKDGEWQPWNDLAHIEKQSPTLTEAIQAYLAHARPELAPVTLERSLY